MSTILLLLTLQTDVAVELAKINARLAVIEAQLGIGGGGGGGVTVTMGGSTADVAWNSVGSSFALDWIGVYAVTAAHQPLGNKPWVYTSSCTTKAGVSTPAAGHCWLSVGALAAGMYEARYFTNDSFTMVVKSAPFSVGATEEIPPAVFTALSNEVCDTAPATVEGSIVWDAPATGYGGQSHPDGYQLLIGAQSTVYDVAINAGNTLWVPYLFLAGHTWCFVVRGYYVVG